MGAIGVTEKDIWAAVIPSTEASMLNSSSPIFLAGTGVQGGPNPLNSAVPSVLQGLPRSTFPWLPSATGTIGKRRVS